MAEPQIGVEVLDRDGKSLGLIDYVVRDTWSGEIKKFMLYRKPPDKDLVFSLDDVSEITDTAVKLNVSA